MDRDNIYNRDKGDNDIQYEKKILYKFISNNTIISKFSIADINELLAVNWTLQAWNTKKQQIWNMIKNDERDYRNKLKTRFVQCGLSENDATTLSSLDESFTPLDISFRKNKTLHELDEIRINVCRKFDNDKKAKRIETQKQHKNEKKRHIQERKNKEAYIKEYDNKKLTLESNKLDKKRLDNTMIKKKKEEQQIINNRYQKILNYKRELTQYSEDAKMLHERNKLNKQKQRQREQRQREQGEQGEQEQEKIQINTSVVENAMKKRYEKHKNYMLEQTAKNKRLQDNYNQEFARNMIEYKKTMNTTKDGLDVLGIPNEFDEPCEPCKICKLDNNNNNNNNNDNIGNSFFVNPNPEGTKGKGYKYKKHTKRSRKLHKKSKNHTRRS